MPIDFGNLTDTAKNLIAGVACILFCVILLMLASGRNRRK